MILYQKVIKSCMARKNVKVCQDGDVGSSWPCVLAAAGWDKNMSAAQQHFCVVIYELFLEKRKPLVYVFVFVYLTELPVAGLSRFQQDSRRAGAITRTQGNPVH